MVEDYRSALLAMSVVKSEFDILSFDQLHNNRQKVKVRVVYYDADGNAVTTSLVRYFLLLNPDGYVVEMLEYIEMPLPLADVEKIVH